jgi:hypothetical protein
MKQLAGLLTIAVIAFSFNSQTSNLKSDLEVSNVKGNVWKIQKTVHKVEGAVCPGAEKSDCNKALYVYNKKGNLIESSEVDENGKIVLISKYVYSGDDVCSEINKYSGNKLIEKQVNILQGGKVTETKVFNEDGTIENIYKYEYSGNELLSGTTLNQAGEVVSSFQNEFLNGQLCSQTERNDIGDISSVTKYKRNTYNDVIESKRSYPKDTSEYKPTFVYEYDNQGNWIQQTQLYNGEIAAIIVRNITYYNGM